LSPAATSRNSADHQRECQQRRSAAAIDHSEYINAEYRLARAAADSAMSTLPPDLSTWNGLPAEEYGSRLAAWLICGVVTEQLAEETLLPGGKRHLAEPLLTHIPREQFNRLIAELPARIKKRHRREALAETIERGCDAFIAEYFQWTKPVSGPPGQLPLL
jgi:hypothetical protein